MSAPFSSRRASAHVRTVNNAIELMDYGRESADLNYAHMIQMFHRFLVDHLSSEGNSFPHNPTLLPNSGPADLLSPAPAPTAPRGAAPHWDVSLSRPARVHVRRAAGDTPPPPPPTHSPPSLF